MQDLVGERNGDCRTSGEGLEKSILVEVEILRQHGLNQRGEFALSASPSEKRLDLGFSVHLVLLTPIHESHANS
jgi:hypothetical protein